MQQILLNVNFCDEIRHCEVRKDGRKVAIAAGDSLAGIRLVPQELAGVCLLYIAGNVREVKLQDIEHADIIEGGCAFVVVQPDISFGKMAVGGSLRRKLERLFTRWGRKGIDVPGVEDLIREAAGVIEADELLWSQEKKTAHRVAELADLVYGSNGRMSLPELSDAAGCTVRHVHRIFSENIGKGPKEFSKIVRIRKTTERIFEDPYESITNYMEEMAYSDQAHFQREFKWYTGYTPGNFIRLNRSVKSSM